MKTGLIVGYLILGFISLRLISCQTDGPTKLTQTKERASRIERLLSDTVNFTHHHLDFDSDGLIDRIISSKHGVGDSLFILKRHKKQYTLSLVSSNYSADGLYVVDSILLDPNRSNGLILKTYFNGPKGMLEDHYLIYNKRSKRWMLDYTIVEIHSGNSESPAYVKTCKIHKGIDLNGTRKKGNWRGINEAYEEECKTIFVDIDIPQF